MYKSVTPLIYFVLHVSIVDFSPNMQDTLYQHAR